MTGPILSFGDALAQGLAQGVGAYTQLQGQDNNQLIQQTQQQMQFEAQQRAQAAQLAQQQAAQAASLQYNYAALGQAGQHWQDQQDQLKLDNARNMASDRDTHFKTVDVPLYNEFLQGINNQLAQVAPLLPDGTRNPAYNPGAYEAAMNQRKAAGQAFTKAGQASLSGDGFEDARAGLYSAIGAGKPLNTAPGSLPQDQQLQGSPAQPAAAPMPAAAPQGLPQAAPVPQSGPAAPAPDAATPQPVTPASMAAVQSHLGLPPSIQQVRPSDFLTLPDDQIVAAYGPSALTYANRARYEIQQQQLGEQLAGRKATTDFWAKAVDQLITDKDHPATADQIAAAGLVTQLSHLTSLTPAQQQQFAGAITQLAPHVLNNNSWQKVLDTKDPTTILAALPMYQKMAPGVTDGFDPTPYQNLIKDTHDGVVADLLQKGATTNKTNAETSDLTALHPGLVPGQTAAREALQATTNKTTAETGRITALQPGEVKQQGAVYDSTVAGTNKTTAETSDLTALHPGLVPAQDAALKLAQTNTAKVVSDMAHTTYQDSPWAAILPKAIDAAQGDPKKLAALTQIGALLQNPNRTAADNATLGDLFTTLTPSLYTADTWKALLLSGKPEVIAAAYPGFKQNAPGVVAGVNMGNIDQAVADAHAGVVSRTNLESSSAALNDTNATRIRMLQPGEVAQQGAVLAGTRATTNKTNVETGRVAALVPGELAQQGAVLGSTQASTDKTVQGVAADKMDLGVKALTTISSFPTNMNYYQIAKANPGLVSTIKTSLGVDDTGAANLIAQAQSLYGQKYTGADLALQIQRATAANLNATRGLTIANTNHTQALTADVQSTTVARNAELQPHLDQLNAQIAQMQKNGQNTDSIIAERNALLPYKVADLQAGTGAKKATTALNWATAAAVPARVKDEQDRTAAYVESLKGNPAMDAAKIAQMGANTLLVRARTPGDPLFDARLLPRTGTTKATDPYAQLQVQAAGPYKAANEAKQLATTIQAQINGEMKKYNQGTLGISPAAAKDPTIIALTAKRDAALADSTKFTNQGNQIISDGMTRLSQPENAPAKMTPQNIVPGADLRKMGFTQDAITAPTDQSFCTRFARQYTEMNLGLPAFSLAKYFKGDATATQNAFDTNNALILKNAAPKDALAAAGSLKSGDVIFLKYGPNGNPKIDHTAIYDGNGGVIQHSAPGFRGETIQGNVNRMGLDEFLSKAGNATVSYGRVPNPAGNKTTTATTPPAQAAPAATTTPAGAPSAIAGLSKQLTQAVKAGNQSAINAFAQKLSDQGWSDQQVLAAIKAAQ